MTARAGQWGQVRLSKRMEQDSWDVDCRNRTASTGQPEKTVGTIQPGLKQRTGWPEYNSKERTARTGQWGWDNHNRTVRIGRLGRDH
jgi:hypothetical protein